MKLIDKDTLVAEIKRRKELVSDPILSGDDLMIGERNAYFNLLTFIDTLEVKEVDEQKERIDECPYRQVGCTMYEGKILECRGACSWVVDYPKLKELKARKVEEV